MTLIPYVSLSPTYRMISKFDLKGSNEEHKGRTTRLRDVMLSLNVMLDECRRHRTGYKGNKAIVQRWKMYVDKISAMILIFVTVEESGHERA